MSSRNHRTGRYQNELAPIGDWLLDIMKDTPMPETDKAIEAAAKAIYEQWCNYPACTNSDPWEARAREMPASAEDFRKKARAALAAGRPELVAEIERLRQDFADQTDAAGTWIAKCYAAEARVTALEEERDGLREQVVCPIGLDDNPAICSAGSCRVCLCHRVEHYQTRAEAAEAEVTRLREALAIADDWLPCVEGHLRDGIHFKAAREKMRALAVPFVKTVEGEKPDAS